MLVPLIILPVRVLCPPPECAQSLAVSGLTSNNALHCQCILQADTLSCICAFWALSGEECRGKAQLTAHLVREWSYAFLLSSAFP